MVRPHFSALFSIKGHGSEPGAAGEGGVVDGCDGVWYGYGGQSIAVAEG